jgi:hypothetical protein
MPAYPLVRTKNLGKSYALEHGIVQALHHIDLTKEVIPSKNDFLRLPHTP